MDIEAYRTYCLSKPGATESFPFGRKPNMLVFKVGGKMFSATDITHFEFIRLKFRPEEVQALRERYPEVIPPQYVDPNHWNHVLMQGALPDDLIQRWIDESYELVLGSLPRAVREGLEEGEG